MPDLRLGLEGVLYLNTGTYNVPVLSKVQNVKDVTSNLERDKANVTTRGSAGWTLNIGALRTLTVDFDMLWNTSDTNFTAIQSAFYANDLAGQSLEFFVMSCDVDQADSEGVRAMFMVDKFTKNEPLDDAQTVSVTISPTYSAHPPQAVTGGPYSGYE